MEDSIERCDTRQADLSWYLTRKQCCLERVHASGSNVAAIFQVEPAKGDRGPTTQPGYERPKSGPTTNFVGKTILSLC